VSNVFLCFEAVYQAGIYIVRFEIPSLDNVNIENLFKF